MYVIYLARDDSSGSDVQEQTLGSRESQVTNVVAQTRETLVGWFDPRPTGTLRGCREDPLRKSEVVVLPGDLRYLPLREGIYLTV